MSAKINSQIFANMQSIVKSVFGFTMKNNSLGNLKLIETIENTRFIYTAGILVAVNLIIGALIMPVALRFTKRWRRSSIAELQERIDVLEKAKKMRSDFFASLSHDIRTPLNGILGIADILGQDETDSEKLSSIRTIKDSGNNLMQVVDEILDVSKLDAGSMNLYPSEVNIADLVKESVSTIDVVCKKKGIDLTVDIESSVPHIYYTDGHKLVRILLNLLGNSLKFTEQGVVSVRVRKNDSPRRGDILFTVVDSGRGIPEDRRDLIFESYVQAVADERLRENGTGLGLAISRGLVELMGGEIWFDSELGRGSTFCFTIGQTPDCSKDDV
ncbi:MAG: hypothetical protein HN337_06150 [Deltaproteobacteria bacterium]|nr:hypothetical protein [Deltaproteobacteria bacterium]